MVWVMKLIISLFINGCAMTQFQDKFIQNNPSNVRVSGDVAVSTIDRKGF